MDRKFFPCSSCIFLSCLMDHELTEWNDYRLNKNEVKKMLGLSPNSNFNDLDHALSDWIELESLPSSFTDKIPYSIYVNGGTVIVLSGRVDSCKDIKWFGGDVNCGGVVKCTHHKFEDDERFDAICNPINIGDTITTGTFIRGKVISFKNDMLTYIRSDGKKAKRMAASTLVVCRSNHSIIDFGV